MNELVVEIKPFAGDRIIDLFKASKNIAEDEYSKIDVVSFDFNGVKIFIDDTISYDDISLYYEYCLQFDINANDYDSFILKNSMIFANREQSRREVEKQFEEKIKKLRSKLKNKKKAFI